MSDAEQPQVPEPAPSGVPRRSTADDVDLAIQGPIRRNAPLLLAVSSIFVIGMPATQMLKAYRAVVLVVEEDRMLVGFNDVPPDWIGLVDAEPGQIIEKQLGSWSPQAVDTDRSLDLKLTEMWTRFSDSYTGRIHEIIPPPTPQGASKAVILTDQGRKIGMTIWSDHLREARVGIRLKKEAGTWDPVLLDDAGNPIAVPE